MNEVDGAEAEEPTEVAPKPDEKPGRVKTLEELMNEVE